MLRWKLIFALCLLPSLSHADEQYDQDISYQNWDFSHYGGGQPANRLTLEDGKTIWVHGCKSGSFVTLGGKPIEAGEYKLKDSKIVISVDSFGKLTTPLPAIKNKIICMD
jgi:hypothetical protein